MGSARQQVVFVTRVRAIYTSYYGNWDSLSREERSAVFEEGKHTGVTNPKGFTNPKHTALKRKTTAAKAAKKMTTLKKSLEKMKRKVASLSKKPVKDDDSDSEEEAPKDAGNAFGGRDSKRSAKKSKSG